MSSQKPVATFDCYGTLIDFALGNAVLPIIADRLDEVGTDHEVFLEHWRVIRFHAVAAGPYTRYQDLIALTLETTMLLHGAAYHPSYAEELLERVRGFTAFPEVPAALAEIADLGVEIAIITNSDRDLVPPHIRALEVDVDHVVTAEDSGWYKPRPGAFEYLFRVLDRDLSLVTHCAQGWDYDIMPTKKYGIDRVWINRAGLPGSDFYAPYTEMPDLTALPGYFRAKFAE